jgi:hypothetical protein
VESSAALIVYFFLGRNFGIKPPRGMISSIDMYNLLREKIGDQQAKTLTDYVEQRVYESFEKEKEWFATKSDIYAVKEDIYAVKEDVQSVKLEVAAVRQSVVEVKAELLKWMITLFTPFYVGMIVFLIKLFWK